MIPINSLGTKKPTFVDFLVMIYMSVPKRSAALNKIGVLLKKNDAFTLFRTRHDFLFKLV